MWLVHTASFLLKKFLTPPAYAILSHRWRDGELSHAALQEMQPRTKDASSKQERDSRKQRLSTSKGGRKLISACEIAQADWIWWIWVDTCCIDKKSSAELSEAINSMFMWYRDAQICYVYLDESPWQESEWFDRGWTLQELLAPKNLRLFDHAWNLLGERAELKGLIAQRTNIDERFLVGSSTAELQRCSVAQRMSWAASRRTTRVEDRAYSLLGIFDVSMPLLYGEGNKAFLRLQEEVIRRTCDHSILVWDREDTRYDGKQILAPDPGAFLNMNEIVSYAEQFETDTFALSNTGLRLRSRVLFEKDQTFGGIYGILNCGWKDHPFPIGMPLSRSPRTDPSVKRQIDQYACAGRRWQFLPADRLENPVHEISIIDDPTSYTWGVPPKAVTTPVSKRYDVFWAFMSVSASLETPYPPARANVYHSKSPAVIKLTAIHRHPLGVGEFERTAIRIDPLVQQTFGWRLTFLLTDPESAPSRGRSPETSRPYAHLLPEPKSGRAYAIDVCMAVRSLSSSVHQPSFLELDNSLVQDTAIQVYHASTSTLAHHCDTLGEAWPATGAIYTPALATFGSGPLLNKVRLSNALTLEDHDGQALTIFQAECRWSLVSETPTLGIRWGAEVHTFLPFS